MTEKNTFNITTHDTIGSVEFYVRDEYTVDINDFPYVVIVLKNFCTCAREEGVPISEACEYGELAGFFYCAGKTLNPDNDHRIPLNADYLYDITPEGSEDLYTIFVGKATAADLLEGPARVHSLRFDYAQARIGLEFEIMYAGYFRDKSDIAEFATSQGYSLTVEDLGADDVEDDLDDPDDWDDSDDDDDDYFEEDITTKKENKTTESQAANNAGGCGSTVGVGYVVITLILSALGIVAFKKREE